MKIKTTSLEGLFLIELETIADGRGYFMKVYSRDFFEKNGVKTDFYEVNQSCSKKNVVRGLHFQWNPPLGKLMRVISGRAYVAAVDIKKKSKTFGQWFGAELTYENQKMLFGQAGLAMGFLALEDNTMVEYHYTAPYNIQGESNILWNDPQVGIEWPISGNPVISNRDASAQSLKAWLERPESDIF